jgi:hypothetical protein
MISKSLFTILSLDAYGISRESSATVELGDLAKYRKRKEGKVVANLMGFFLPPTSRYGVTLFTCLIAKLTPALPC